MSSNISERIQAVMKEVGLNKNSFSKAIGLTNNVTIGRIINEQREPSFDVLTKIIQKYGHLIDANWLITGEGEMLLQDSQFHEPSVGYHPGAKDGIKKSITNLEFLADSLKSELEKLKSKLN